MFFVIGYYFGVLVSPKEPTTTSTLPIEETKLPKKDWKEGRFQAAWVDLKNISGRENVITDESALASYSDNGWSSHDADPKDVPFMIVRPASTEEVSQIVRVCWERDIPITAKSGGTSLEGHFATTEGGVAIDFGRMNKVLKIHKDDLDIVVQPGVDWESLKETLGHEGLLFPPDPGPGAMIGGMIGTGCSGTNAYRYGTMREWVLSLTVVLADGTIVKTRQRPRKSSAGYNMTQFFIGSEGTLGLVTEAVLKVTPLPQDTSVAVCAFDSIRAAATAASNVVKTGVPVAAIEILDDEQMKFINAAGMTTKSWKEAPTLFFKFAGTPTSVKEHISQVRSIAKSAGSKSFEFAKNEDECEELWSARKEALWATIAAKKTDTERVWTTDVAVPISRLPEIIDETKADLASSGLAASIVGHVGDGNFHTIILYDPAKPEEEAKVKDVVHRMVKRAIEMEGTATGEHGVGLVKRDYLEHENGKEYVDLIRKLKLAIDPKCILNCGKVLRVVKPRKGETSEW